MYAACIFWMTILFIFVLVVGFQRARQKTRNTQQRRTFIGTNQHPSDTQAEPTIYVSPANFSPPPKYEAMAPPSYDEVVGIHYPNFQLISHPISTALAQTSNTTDPSNGNVVSNNANNANNANVAINNGESVLTSNTQTPPTVISVVSERSPVTASS